MRQRLLSGTGGAGVVWRRQPARHLSSNGAMRQQLRDRYGEQQQPRRRDGTAATAAAVSAAAGTASALPQLAELSAAPSWNLGVAVAAALGAWVWVKAFDALARSGVLEQKLSVRTSARPMHRGMCKTACMWA
jgi:uncharacterized membrane protein